MAQMEAVVERRIECRTGMGMSELGGISVSAVASISRRRRVRDMKELVVEIQIRWFRRRQARWSVVGPVSISSILDAGQSRQASRSTWTRAKI